MGNYLEYVQNYCDSPLIDLGDEQSEAIEYYLFIFEFSVFNFM